MKPTPEMDAVIANDSGDSGYLKNLATKGQELERQRDEALELVEFLKHGIAGRGQEIEQTCGKALGYPWFKDDQENFPGATDADGVCVGEHVPETIVSELANAYQKASAQRDAFRDGIIAALEENRHLADGEICTLSTLKKLVPEW